MLHKLLISLTQPTFLPLTFRSLSQTFIRRSMINSSSGSCHDSDATWQEIGRTCGSEPEEELIILLLMKVSDRDRNVKGKNVGCVKLISD